MQINEIICVTREGTFCARCGRQGRQPCAHAQDVDVSGAQHLLERPPKRRSEPRWEIVGHAESEHLNGRYELLRLLDGTMACTCLSFLQSAGVLEVVYAGGIGGSGCKHLRRHVGQIARPVRTRPNSPSDWQKYLLRSLCAECPQFLTAEQAYFVVRRGLELQGVRYTSLVSQMRRQQRIRLLPVWAFGVEIEAFGVSFVTLTQALSDAGVPVLGAVRSQRANGSWKVTGDGSIRGENPFELVSPKLVGQPGFDQLGKVCRIVRSAGGQGNASCGLHVHIDAFNLSLEEIQRLCQLWHKIERPILHRLVSASRRTNHFCAPLTGQTYSQILAASDRSQLGLVDRYHSLNVAAYGRHGSLEIRLHQHSLNAGKIRAWATLQLLLASAVKQGLQPRQVEPTWPSLAEALDVTNGTPLVRRAWELLTTRFNGSEIETPVSEAA